MQLIDPDDSCKCQSGLRWAECCGRSLPLTLRYVLVRLLEEDDHILSGCGRGGHCCRNVHVPLTAFDVLRLAQHLGQTTGEFLSEFAVVTSEGGVEIDGSPECPFLDGNTCGVYSSRPDSCRMYPFWRVVSGDSEWLVERHTCSGCWQECRSERMTVHQFLHHSGAALGQKMESLYQDDIRQLESLGASDERIEEFMSDVYDSNSSFDPSEERFSENHDSALAERFQDVVKVLKERTLKRTNTEHAG